MKLTTDNILQVAIEMGKIGRTFYESLSVGCGHAEIADLTSSLARAEKEHSAAFERMRNALPPNQRGLDLSGKDLFAAVEEMRSRIMPNSRIVHQAVHTSDLFKTLDMAIEIENEAIAFYSGLASEITGLDNDVLAGIVAEEKDHLRMLREVRALFASSRPEQ